MDRNSPDSLSDDPHSAYEDSKRLIERWHGQGRLGYAITPRFALTSSEEQLAAAGRLADEYPDTWVHTHLAENTDEIEQVAHQFPWSDSYLDVYDQFRIGTGAIGICALPAPGRQRSSQNARQGCGSDFLPDL